MNSKQINYLPEEQDATFETKKAQIIQAIGAVIIFGGIGLLLAWRG